MPRTTKSISTGNEPEAELTPMPRARDARDAEPTLADLAAVAAAVEDALPGVRVLDRALEFEDGARADLAGVDAAGRLVLVRLATEDGDRSTLGVLDLLAFVRTHGELVARHLGAPRPAATLLQRIVVILEPGDRVLAARLGAVSAAGLELYDLRTVKSAAGERAYLVARAGGAVLGGGGPANLQRFLDALPPGQEELGRELCARLARLDDELRTEGGADAISWFFRDRPLVRLESRSGRLSGVVGAEGRPRELDARRDADELLEAALSRLMQEVGRDGAPERAEVAEQGGRRGGHRGDARGDARGGHRGDARGDARGGARGDAGESELALLSPEEIQAFRD